MSAAELLRSAADAGLTVDLQDPALDAETGAGASHAAVRDAQTAAAVWAAASEHGAGHLADAALAHLQTAIAGADTELRRRIGDHVLLVPGTEALPWPELIPDPRGLALLYNFSPFQDTGSTVASKRLRQFGQTVDVIACSFLHHKKADPTIERISAPYVKSKYFVPAAPSWATWAAHAAFAMKAANLADRYMAERETPYEFLYSRAMWAPSLIAGALVKLRHPRLRWVAEFSDPMSQDVEGNHRGGPTGDDECARTLVAAFEARHGRMDEQQRSIFALAENMVFALADEIIFTNALQKHTMLAKVQDPVLRQRIESVATVSHHPSLPRPFYRMCPARPPVSDEHLNIAYFGEFYSSRGLIEVTSAMRTLPEHLRERVRLHVFTNYVPAAEGGRRPRNFSARQYADLVSRAVDGVGAQGIEHLVAFHPSLPFLEFLSATDAFDLLVVRDAATGDHHEVNPYLPSKWSDYSGSTAATWAILEQDSTMSRLDPPHRSPVNDVAAAREVLWSALEAKFGDLSGPPAAAPSASAPSLPVDVEGSGL